MALFLHYACASQQIYISGNFPKESANRISAHASANYWTVFSPFLLPSRTQNLQCFTIFHILRSFPGASVREQRLRSESDKDELVLQTNMFENDPEGEKMKGRRLSKTRRCR